MMDMLVLQNPESIPVSDGELRYWRDFLDPQEASALCGRLRDCVAWQQTVLRIGGQRIPIPRLNAWYGDPGARYGYSGTTLKRNDWLPELAQLRRVVGELTGQDFNSCLVNWYRDGHDSVDWHSDDEPELGRNPAVASVSLGVERRFQLRHKSNGAIRNLQLEHGSLLLMSGPMQHYWEHRLPKDNRVCEDRINITFRRVDIAYNGSAGQ